MRYCHSLHGPGCFDGGSASRRRGRGKRYALPNSRIMIHQPMGGYQGQATDIDIHAKEILRMREDLNKILAKHTNHTVKKIGTDTERDNFMSAAEAVKYGIIDKVLTKRTQQGKEEENE